MRFFSWTLSISPMPPYLVQGMLTYGTRHPHGLASSGDAVSRGHVCIWGCKLLEWTKSSSGSGAAPLNLRPEGGVADRALVVLEGRDGNLGVATATVKEMARVPGFRSSLTSLKNYWPIPRSTALPTGAPPNGGSPEYHTRLVLTNTNRSLTWLPAVAKRPCWQSGAMSCALYGG